MAKVVDALSDPTVQPASRTAGRRRGRRATVGATGAVTLALTVGILANGASPDLTDGASYPPLERADRGDQSPSIETLPPPPATETSTPATSTSSTTPETTPPTPPTTPATTQPSATQPPATQPPTTQPPTTLPPNTTAPPTTTPATTQPPNTTPATTQPPATTPATTLPRVVQPPSGGELVVGDVANVPANYEVDDHLRTGMPLPASTAHEPTGNFRMICEYSHLAYDDPIVAPGVPGVSHLHMFFGNTLANANSTYASLRTQGDSTCQGGPLNRSAYWAPAVIDAAGDVVVPDFISVYYKGRGTGTDGTLVDVAELPAGFRMIAGAIPGDPSAPSQHRWYCEASGSKSLTIPTCPQGERVGVSLTFPTCWDGVRLDAADHRSHLQYSQRDPNTGVLKCPPTHPVSIPAISLGIWFTHNGDSASWHLSSDREPGSTTHGNGASFHSDWFGAWDLDVQAQWTDVCINGELNCSWGELGDGTALSVNPDYTGPQRITPPAPPTSAQHAALVSAEQTGVATLTCSLYS